MYKLLFILNLIAIVAWLFLVGYVFVAFFKIRTIKMRIKKKRMIVSYYVLPMFFMTVFYFSLLLLWIILDYDKTINICMGIAWSLFHILTPVLFLVYIKAVIKYIAKIIEPCE